MKPFISIGENDTMCENIHQKLRAHNDVISTEARSVTLQLRFATTNSSLPGLRARFSVSGC